MSGILWLKKCSIYLKLRPKNEIKGAKELITHSTIQKRFSLLILILATILLPFSSGVSTGLVFSYALPLLLLFLITAMTFYPKVVVYSSDSIVLAVAFVSAVIPLLTSFLTTDPLKGIWRALAYLMGFLILLIFCYNRAFRGKFSRYLTLSSAWFSIALSLYYLINFLYKSITIGLSTVLLERYVGGAASLPWGASNTIAACLLIGIIVSLFSFNITKMRIYYFAYIISFLTILMTFSRTAIILSVLYLLAFSLITHRKKIVILPLLTVALLAIVALLATGGVTVALERLVQDRTNTQDLTNLNSRSDIWTTFLNYFSDHPFSPLGYYGALQKFGVSAHNSYLTTLVEQGFLGLIAMISLPLVVGMRLLRHVPTKKLRRANLCLLIGLLTVHINLFFEDPNFTHQYIIMYWIFISLIVSWTIRSEKEKSV